MKIIQALILLFTITALSQVPYVHATNCQIHDLKVTYPATVQVQVPFKIQVWFNPLCDGASYLYRADILDQNQFLVGRAYNNIPYITVQVTPHNITSVWSLMLVIHVDGAGSYGDTGWHFNVTVTGPYPPPPPPKPCIGKNCEK